MTPSRIRRISAWLLALLMTGLLFITVLPELMRIGAIALLERQGSLNASIGDIDFNPFTGEFEIRQLTTSSGAVLQRAKIRLDWWPLWHRRLAITELHGDLLTLNITQHTDGSLDIGGLVIPAANNVQAATPKEESGTGWQITLPSADFTRLDLTLKLPANGQAPARDTRITLDDLYLYHLTVSDKAVQVDELRLDGFAGRDSAGQLPKSLLRLQLYGLKIDAIPLLQLDEANILGMALAPAAPLSGGSIDRIVIRQLRAAPKGPLSLAKLKVENATLPAFRSTQLGGFASFELDGVKGKSPEQLDIDRLTLKRLQLPSAKTARLGHIGQLALQNMALQLKGNAPTIQTGNIRIANITLPSDSTAKPGSIGAIDIAELDANDHRIGMSTLAIRDLQASLLRRKDGSVATPRMPIDTAGSKTSTQTAQSIPANKAKRESLQLHIGDFSVTGNSRISIRDESVQPVFKSEVAIQRFAMAPLALGRAEAGRLDIDLTLDQQSRLQVKGSLTPDPAHLTADLSIALKELNLPALSPYIEQALHFAIKTGQLDIDSKAKVSKETLDSKNGIHVRRLQIATDKDSPMVGGMTIDTALEMIRDDKGDINLDVPLKGPLDNIQAGLSDVINQALLTAMQKAALAYASQYLYPYGTIISVASTVAKAAMAQPRLTPVAFPPLQAKLDEKGLDYAGKIAGLLKDKKGIRLQLCGVASPAEAQAAAKQEAAPDAEHLLDLAKARSSQVIATIAGYGIATERLFACKPEIDRSENAKGRVEMLLE